MPQRKYDDELRGALFVNKTKQPGDRRPDREGYVQVEGKRYRVAGWLRTARDSGESFLSLKLTADDSLSATARRATAAAAQVAETANVGAAALDAALDVEDDDEALAAFRKARAARAAKSDEVPF